MILMSAALTSQAQQADESEDAATNAAPPSISAEVRDKIQDSFVPYRYSFIRSGADRYTFLLPDGMRIDSSDPSKVNLFSHNLSCLITLCPVNTGSKLGAGPSADTLRSIVASRHPRAEITDEGSIGTDGQMAPSIDFIWKSDSGLNRKSRMLLIPTSTGFIEFNMTTGVEKFQSSIPDLNLILLTFRRGTNGRFEYVKGSKDI